MGHRVSTRGAVYEWAREVERVRPTLEQINAAGQRVDRVVVSPAWHRLRAFTASEGIVSAAYERKFGVWRCAYRGQLRTE